MGDHPSVALFKEASKINLPVSLNKVPEQVKTTAFFPGGYGLCLDKPVCTKDDLPEFPEYGIMAVLDIFDSQSAYDCLRIEPGSNLSKQTWRGIYEIYRENGVEVKDANYKLKDDLLRKTFFTNAHIGLYTNNKEYKKIIKKNEPYRNACYNFFCRQVECQKPRLILALGLTAKDFLARTHGLECWIGKNTTGMNSCRKFKKVHFGNHCTVVAFLANPARRGTNVNLLKYDGLEREQADIQVFRDAVKVSGLENDSVLQETEKP